MNDEEFHDWIATHLSYKNDWSAVLTPQKLEATRQSVAGLLQVLEQQLETIDGTEEWKIRIGAMVKMCNARLAQIDLRLNNSNKNRQLQEWRQTLHEVVALVLNEGSDEMVDRLNEIVIPFDNIGLGDWYDKRLDKRGL